MKKFRRLREGPQVQLELVLTGLKRLHVNDVTLARRWGPLAPFRNQPSGPGGWSELGLWIRVPLRAWMDLLDNINIEPGISLISSPTRLREDKLSSSYVWSFCFSFSPLWGSNQEEVSSSHRGDRLGRSWLPWKPNRK